MVHKAKVLKCAITSRLIILGLQVFFNAVIEDHDAGVFLKPGPSTTITTTNDVERCLHFLLEGLERWDGQYFLNVAEHGYVYEKTLAFFPLFPLLTRLVAATLLSPLRLLVGEHLVLLTSAALLNQALFCTAAVLVYLLGRELLTTTDADAEQRAYKAALLFCYNPASIFFSAAYSESTFSVVTFAGMLLVERDCGMGATAAFALSALVRSNGTVNAGFLLYAGIIKPFLAADRRKLMGGNVATIVGRLALGILQALVVVASFALFQQYAYKAFCLWPRPATLSDDVLALNARDPEEYVLPGTGSTAWCQSLIPLSYGYVQSRYWNVGFFSYFEARQIPNFVLATPAVLVCLHGIFRYAIRLLKAFARSHPMVVVDGQHRQTLEKQHLRVLPYVVHCSFLLVFGITAMHVQVITRLVASSTPIFYLFAAAMLPDLPAELAKNNGHHHRHQKATSEGKTLVAHLEDHVPLLSYWPRRKHLKRKSKLVLAYFAFYYITGTACFANFLPWT